MPGISGIVSKPNVSDLQADLSCMNERLMHHSWYQQEEYVNESDGIGLGRVSLGFLNTESQPASLPDREERLVLDGEILRFPESAETSSDQATRLLQGFVSSGGRFLQQIHGKFNAAVWDPQPETLTLMNDQYGMKPLYYVHAGNRFAFSSELKALFAIGLVEKSADHRGVIEFFTFGHLWGTNTLYENVKVLPPGCTLRFCRADNTVSIDSYSELPRPKEGALQQEGVLEQISQAFRCSVSDCASDREGLGIALSGGMDARTMLALIEEPCDSLQALCMGMQGSRDQVSARQMAAIKGCQYHDFMLDQHFLQDFEQHLDRMVHLTDGHYLSQCIVMPTFEKYRELGIRVLLRGHAGELMHMRKAYSFSLDDAAFGLKSSAALEDWLFQHLSAYMLDALDEPLLAFSDQQECNEVAREAIRNSLASSADWERPVDRIWQVFITERLRRETAMSLAKFGSVVETRLPYLSPDVLNALSEAPAELKQDEAIQAYMLHNHYPQFLNIVNVNTGAKVGAGELTKKFHSFKMRVFAKLGVPGYQPYERLGLWLRRELAPLVKKILLDEQCLDRGVFRPSAVRSAVNQHLTGQRNHTFLLMAMMIYERGQQMAIAPAHVQTATTLVSNS